MKLLDPGTYYGTTVQKKQVSQFTLSETFYHSNCKIPAHHHKNFYICLVVKGEYSESYLNKNIICSEGDIIIHPSYLQHSNLFHQKTGICFNIEISGSISDRIQIPDLFQKKFSHSIFNNNIKKAYKEFKQNDHFSPLIIEGLILETIGHFGREAESIGPYWLKKVKEIANEECAFNISLSDIARQLHISPSHLAREFKKSNGITLGEYIQSIKIERACDLIKNSKIKLSVISEKCGFADQAHFTRTFKKVMNVTPSLYRTCVR